MSSYPSRIRLLPTETCQRFFSLFATHAVNNTSLEISSEKRRIKKGIYSFVSALLAVILSIGSVSARQTPSINMIDISLGSPQAAELAKYGNNEVSMFKGVPNVTIPIYTIQLKGFELPIYLSYDASGIKVDQIATNVGLGWTLQAGGMITAATYSLPERLYDFDLPATPLKDFDPNAGFPSGSPTTDYTYASVMFPPDGGGVARNIKPDLFYYNFGGRSGKFMVNQALDISTGFEAFTVPQNNLEIINRVHTNQGFEIIDEHGNRYLFENEEVSTITQGTGCDISPGDETSPLSEPQDSYTWHLTKIITINNDTLSFEYDLPGLYEYDDKLVQQKYKRNTILSSCAIIQDYSCQNKKKVRPYVLSKISHSRSGLVVDFMHNGARDDFGDSTYQKLADIEVSLNGNEIQNHSFTHSYFSSGGVGKETKRLKLDAVQRDGMPGYEFEYNMAGNLPARGDFAQDKWGYYNGKSNLTLVPNGEGLTGAADRSVDVTKAGYWAIKKIIYPTGGKTEFNLEADSAGGGLRVASIFDLDGMGNTVNERHYDYTRTDFGYLTFLDDHEVYYWDNGISTVGICDYDMYTSSSVLPINVIDGPDFGYTTVRVDYGGVSGPEGYSIYNYSLGVGANEMKWGRGDLVKERHYREDDKLLRQVEYEFESSFDVQDLTPDQSSILKKDHEVYFPVLDIRLLLQEVTPGEGPWEGTGAYYRPAKFEVEKRVLASGWYRPTHKTETVYDLVDQTKILTTTTESVYETASPAASEVSRKLRSFIETNSNNEVRKTHLVYAKEINSNNPKKSALFSVEIVDPMLGTDSTLSKRTSTWSNTLGSSRYEVHQIYDRSNMDSVLVQEVLSYDSYGNPLGVEAADGSVTKYYYGSNTSPFQNATTTANAVNGVLGTYLTGIQKVQGTDDCASNCGTRPGSVDDLFTEATYDEFGRVTTITDENNQSISYLYDDFSRLISTRNANGMVTSSQGYGYSASMNEGSYSNTQPNQVESITYIDPFYYTDFSSSSGWSSVDSYNTFNVEAYGETTVRMGGDGGYKTMLKALGEEDIIARIDFYPDNTTGGTPHIYLDGGGNRFGFNYLPAINKFRIQYRISPTTAFTSADTLMLDAPPNQWYTIELQKSGGELTAWVYPKGQGRDPDNHYSVMGFSTSWTPEFRLSTNNNYFYAANLSVAKASQSGISYLDGLGREIQTQVRGGTRVIATETLYNERGLPEVVSQPIDTTTTAFPGFYSSGLLSGGNTFTPGSAMPTLAPVASHYTNYHGGAGDNDDLYAYSYTQYEASPLARVEKSTLPGEDHQTLSSQAVTTTYGLNTDTLETFTLYDGESETFTWPRNRLSKTISKDPDGKRTITYTDGWGRTIASGVDMDTTGTLDGKTKGTCTAPTCDLITEYAYDVRGNLVRVEDPRGLVTTYAYNTLGQLTSKKLPDQEYSVEYKYDDAGRLRFTQDANQQSAKQDLSQSLSGGVSVSKTIVANNDGVLSFNFTWVDLFLGNYSITIKRTEDNSTVYSNTVTSEWGSISTQTFNVGPGTYVFTGQAGDPGDIVTTSGNFGFESNDIYTYTLYDELGRPIETGEYSGGTTFPNANPDNDTFPTSGNTDHILYHYDGDQAYSGSITPTNLKGRLTKTSYRDLSVATATWGHTYYSYNTLGLVEWVVQDLPGLSEKIIEYTYDQLGRQTQVEYQADSTDAFYQRYNYDELGRLDKVETSTNGSTWAKDAEYSAFRADGQVAQLKLGNSTIQTVDYAYTIQGWLEKINNGSISTGTNGDRFGMNLSYTNSGNISQQQWRQVGTSGTNQNQLSYTYSYDNANRLKAANFSGGYGSGAFDLSSVGYDKNGNITGFIRNDENGSSYPDGYLSLTFESGTNRLTNIQEQVDYTNWDVDHDASGNMIKNELQGFSSIDYDWRNLPALMIAGSNTLQYAYDAEGNRVKKNLTTGVETHYVRGANGETLAIYEDDVLKSQNILAGSDIIGTWDGSQRRYFLKDHLGSIRTTVDQSGNVDGYDDYYPFGLVMPGRSSNSSNPTSNYKFTGYEIDEIAGTDLNLYHANARGYDPVLGRFMQIDPMSHLYPGVSTYAYVANNPLLFVDPTGETIEVCNGSEDERNCVIYEAGMEYDGDDEFISNTISVLNQINSVENGASVLGNLISSENMFSFENIASKGGDMSMSFSPNSDGGGTINASALFNPDLQEGQKIEAIAHELFHGFQYENGQQGVAANGVNNEVGAGLFGKSIAFMVGHPIAGAGTNSEAGRVYGSAFDNLLFGNSFNALDYQKAVNNFKKGSVANFVGNGFYNNFGLNNNLSNPLIKRFFPLIK